MMLTINGDIDSNNLKYALKRKLGVIPKTYLNFFVEKFKKKRHKTFKDVHFSSYLYPTHSNSIPPRERQLSACCYSGGKEDQYNIWCCD